MWRHTSTFGLQPSRGSVPCVPWRCSVCARDMLSNLYGFTHKSRRDVPDVPGSLKSSLGHIDHQTPSGAYCFIIFRPNTWHFVHIFAPISTTFRQFQASSGIIVAICAQFEGSDGNPLDEVQDVQAKPRNCQALPKCLVQVFSLDAQSGTFWSSLQAIFSWRRFGGHLWTTFRRVTHASGVRLPRHL